MWSNLRSMQTGGLIAKIGDVVAPKSSEDDEYESESGSDSYEDEDYDDDYDEEGSNGMEDVEEEEIDYQQPHASPSKSLNEMGKLFGGVLQKGKEKLSETARNLVEPDHISYDSHEDEGPNKEEEEEEGLSYGNAESFSNTDENEKGSDIGEETDLIPDESKEDLISDYDPKGSKSTAEWQTESVERLKRQEQTQYNVENVHNYVTDISPDVAVNDSFTSLSLDDNLKEETIKALEDSESTLKQGNLLDMTEKDVTDITSDRTIVDGEDVDRESFTEDDFIDENVLPPVPQQNGNVAQTPSENEESDGCDPEGNDNSDEVNTEQKDTTSNVDYIDNSYNESSEAQKPLNIQNVEANELGKNSSSDDLDTHNSNEDEVKTSDTVGTSISIMSIENRFNYAEEHSMENGNEPRAVEVLDDTVGHAYHLQEIGLDRTVGHHLEISGQQNAILGSVDSDLDETTGHHVRVPISDEAEVDEALDSTQGHSVDLTENGLDETTGHHVLVSDEAEVDEALDSTQGHSVDLTENGLDETTGHHVLVSDEAEVDEALDSTQGHSNLTENGLDETIGNHISEEVEVDEALGSSVDLNLDKQSDPSAISKPDNNIGQQVPTEDELTNGLNHEQSVLKDETESISKVSDEKYEKLMEEASSRIKTIEAARKEDARKHNQQLMEMESKCQNFIENYKQLAEEATIRVDGVESIREKDAVKHSQQLMDVETQYQVALEKSEEKAGRAMLEMEEACQQLEHYRRMCEDASSRVEEIQKKSKKDAQKHSRQLAEMEKKHSISLERLEKKVNRTMSSLEEKDKQIIDLNGVIADMKSTIEKNVEDHEAVEDEADELHQENEELKTKMEEMKKERKELKNDIKKLKEENGKTLGVQIELQLLREERDRANEKVESLKESQTTDHSNLSAERDAAKAEALDLEQRLTTIHADLDIVRSDYERSIIANSNLQAAMEAFQVERESELDLLDESRISAEEAMKASHDLALQSMRQENENTVREVQLASNKSIQNIMSEMALTEQKLEESLQDNLNIRRSLDEAINRLQTNQEDVIDRSLIKNILLDWHSKSGKAKKDVMLILASVLHFSEIDKDKCGIGESSSTMDKVVGAVAPPLTPAMKTPEELDGDNIREKWVSFLLAECRESPTDKAENKIPTKRGRQNRSTQSLEL